MFPVCAGLSRNQSTDLQSARPESSDCVEGEGKRRGCHSHCRAEGSTAGESGIYSGVPGHTTRACRCVCLCMCPDCLLCTEHGSRNAGMHYTLLNCGSTHTGTRTRTHTPPHPVTTSLCTGHIKNNMDERARIRGNANSGVSTALYVS